MVILSSCNGNNRSLLEKPTDKIISKCFYDAGAAAVVAFNNIVTEPTGQYFIIYFSEYARKIHMPE